MNTRTISPQEAMELLGSRAEAVALDVRTPVEFAESHIPGFRNLPVQELDRAEFADCSKPIVLLCRSGKRAEMAANKLSGVPGELLVVYGGLDGWKAAGLPVERTHGGPLPLERQVQVAIGTILVAVTAVGALWHPAVFYLAGFIGAGLIFAGLSGTCALGMLIARMPWNRRSGVAGCAVKAGSASS